MKAAERRCANPECPDPDISDLRAGAIVCRRKACKSWRDRGGSLYSPCTASCPAVGWCRRHGRYNRQPRAAPEIKRLHHYEPEGLRTRLDSDPVPEFAPRAEDFEKADGTQLYAETKLPEISDEDVERRAA